MIGLQIRSADRVESIQVFLDTGILEKHGGDEANFRQFGFEPDEYIRAISGRSSNRLNQISIHTNKRTYGPLGGNGGSTFRLSAEKDEEIVGFFGGSGNEINRLGAIVRPLQK